MSRLAIGLLVWVPAFLALELPAHWNLVPWPTFSSTIWDAIKWWHPIAYLVALALLVLLGHFDAHWSVRWLLALTVVGGAVILAHVATRHAHNARHPAPVASVDTRPRARGSPLRR